ncbi:UDP-N-acetylmuramoylalanyl-D-glutamyl-2,6-diamin opimelate/D-alanyl-D-alanyl ligase [Segniliparus rotundus DSM 44985]|uniref:UDP-N-acetylmuramoyl-tripeptide--D-alanyl-D-alanine ligase n=1 Tax=Segniliparus rotundus (strain ATCC BAA-972 / CDC 1076 / CIP 108378 / DSM 44985 / JCM 13578) TaxID=640132 RepID=D6ZC52_SEGRD|nr:UDP-N-acetylmuramoyl-tripeptide--D-alanyl-D-alanine ligase [Segniliparus rotundus]ADG99021.1 UDP-N-acetylmuramoylalanyl-D-glutamyl-2,6-diamin opimelate/D-alanyl-D-alanyl ligase [Segniliparus rotundus DSM 44985]
MIPWTLRQVAAAVGGKLHQVPDPEQLVTAPLEHDSRKVVPGGLFLAVPGERTDGRSHAAAAHAAGAVATLSSDPLDVPTVVLGAGPYPTGPQESRRLALAALAALAKANAQALVARGLTVVGITGSSGKTSTKDLVTQVLATRGATVGPPGSFNNELGHPWTVLRADQDTRFLVLELAARTIGHIAELAQIAQPRIGVVLGVGSAHLGVFGSRENIAIAKGELVEALPCADDGGVAVLNADDPLVSAMASRTRARVVRYGMAESADVRAADVRLDPLSRASFTLITPQGDAPVTLRVHGEHQAHNALAAAAVAAECGLSPAQTAEALSAAQAASPRRMQVAERADGVVVVNDSYNANPESMRAGLRALVGMAHQCGGASWAVLGQMGELGDDSIVLHDQLGRFVVRLSVDRLVVVGDSRSAKALHTGAVLEGSWSGEAVLVPDWQSAARLVAAELGPRDVVLVKASQSEGLWQVAEALLEPRPSDAAGSGL